MTFSLKLIVCLAFLLCSVLHSVHAGSVVKPQIDKAIVKRSSNDTTPPVAKLNDTSSVKKADTPVDVTIKTDEKKKEENTPAVTKPKATTPSVAPKPAEPAVEKETEKKSVDKPVEDEEKETEDDKEKTETKDIASKEGAKNEEATPDKDEKTEDIATKEAAKNEEAAPAKPAATIVTPSPGGGSKDGVDEVADVKPSDKDADETSKEEKLEKKAKKSQGDGKNLDTGDVATKGAKNATIPVATTRKPKKKKEKKRKGDPKKPSGSGADKPKLYSTDESTNSHFLVYMISTIAIVGFIYVLYHNKQKVLALVIEGRVPSGSRRSATRRSTGMRLSSRSTHEDAEELLPTSSQESRIY